MTVTSKTSETSGFTIAGIVREWAVRAPDSPALTCGTWTLSWRELEERSARAAGALAATGVGAGSRVAVLDKNGTAHVEVMLGCGMLGAVYVPVNWRLAPTEVAQIVNDSESPVLVLSSEFLPVLKQMQGELAHVREIVVVGLETGGMTAYEDWLSAATPATTDVSVGGEDAALQLYTSGTTGLPRGAMLSNRGLACVFTQAARLKMDQRSVSLAAMPFFHVGGIGWLLFGLSTGAHTVLLRELDARQMLRLIPQHRVTHFFAVPAALKLLCRVLGVDEHDYSSLVEIVYGTAPIHPDLLTDCQEIFGCDFAQIYGLTETTGAIATLSRDVHADPARRHLLAAAGQPMPGVELRCVDPSSEQDVPEGETGEVWVKSPQNMLGYWNQPGATAAAFAQDGWLRTGDLGHLQDGYLFITDRLKDLVITGGMNVFPAQVEKVLLAHPVVIDAAVIGVPSEQWGEELRAVIVVQPRARYDVEEIQRFCRLRMADYKVPKQIRVVDELPRNSEGRVLKRVLREPYWEGRQRPIA